MKFIFSLFTLFCFYAGASQTSSSDFLDMYLDVTEKKEAKYERKLYKIDDHLFEAEILLMSGAIKAKGGYLEIEGDLVPHGYFTFYYPNGQKESEGKYKEGFKVDTWRRYMMDGTERSPKYYDSDLGNMIYHLKE